MKAINAGKHLLIVTLVGVVAGCKLAVIAVEGGEVHSDRSGICAPNAICFVDVSDPYYADTFGVAPHEGWYFVKWNSGDRFFCSGSSDPTCNLSFQGHEENPIVPRTRGLLTEPEMRAAEARQVAKVLRALRAARRMEAGGQEERTWANLRGRVQQLSLIHI